MNFTKNRSISLFLVFLSFSLFVQANDFTTIYQRMYDEYLTNPGTEGIDRVLNEMSTQGSFSDINYTTKEGTPREHAIRLASMASAYKNPKNKYHNSINLKFKYLAGLQFWITTNHNASNWWFRYIAYPKEISKGVVLMANEIKNDTALYRQTIQYLRWSFENANAGRLTGANGADIIIGSMTAAVLTENHNQMLRFQSKMDSLLTIQDKGDGIEPDYMFAQHSGKGRQLYVLNYGKEYINSAIYFLELCNNTQYVA